MKQEKSDRYDKLSKTFHWVTAIAVVIAFILGPGDFGQLIQQGTDPGTRLDIVWHESLGLLVFTLTFLRLTWVVLRPSAPKFNMAKWMHRVSRLVHIALWALLFALPLSAIFGLATEGYPLTLLGGIRIAEFPLIANSPLKGIIDWGDVHSFLGNAIVWLAGVHAFAAIYHHFKLRDGVLTSMRS